MLLTLIQFENPSLPLWFIIKNSSITFSFLAQQSLCAIALLRLYHIQQPTLCLLFTTERLRTEVKPDRELQQLSGCKCFLCVAHVFRVPAVDNLITTCYITTAPYQKNKSLLQPAVTSQCEVWRQQQMGPRHDFTLHFCIYYCMRMSCYLCPLLIILQVSHPIQSVQINPASPDHTHPIQDHRSL